MTVSDKDKDKIDSAQIVITSFLPTLASRAKRLEFHMRQRRELKEILPQMSIVSICSGYKEKELKLLGEQRWSYIALDKPTPKWRKHNLVLRRLYAYSLSPLRNVLFLDDDVIFRTAKDTDVENGIVDPVALIKFWLANPEQMVGQICYFAFAGGMTDAYYKGSSIILGPPPTPINGTAIMVRSDLDVLYTKELVEDPDHPGMICDDFTFKTKCLAEGKTVLKHYRAFFKSYQSNSKTEDQSSIFQSQEQRNATNKLHSARVRLMFPQCFVRKGKSMKPETGFFNQGKTT